MSHFSPHLCREVEEGRLAATVWRELRQRAARAAKKNDDSPATVSERWFSVVCLFLYRRTPFLLCTVCTTNHI
jgi:hypothetical protein